MADDFGHESIKNEAFSFKKNNHEKRHILGIFPRQSTGQILSKRKIQTPAELSDTKPKPSPAERKKQPAAHAKRQHGKH